MSLDRFENNPAEDASDGRSDAPREEVEMLKERETKEDGRYIIFYSFDEAREEADA